MRERTFGAAPPRRVARAAGRMPQAHASPPEQAPAALVQRALHGAPLAPGQVLHLQRTLGNRAVAGMLTAAPRGAVQRVTLKELFDKLSMTQLGLLSSWLTARAGEDTDAWDKLLAMMSEEEVLASMKLYGDRVEAERSQPTLEEVIESGISLAPPGKDIDKLMLGYPDIALLTAKRYSEGVKVEGEVVVLEDAAFAKKHWEDFQALNAHLLDGKSKDIIEHFRLLGASKIDRVDGFQSSVDGKIYMRPGKLGFRVAVHEAVHKYGGQVFEALLGHVLNEGATDYIALLVCAQIGAEIEVAYYQREKTLLMEILKALKVSDEELFAAYFLDKAEGIVKKLVERIGPEHAVRFRKAKTVGDAVKAFNEGQQRMDK
jgi:hypothetical protein